MKRLMIMLLCALLAVPASAEQMTQETALELVKGYLTGIYGYTAADAAAFSATATRQDGCWHIRFAPEGHPEWVYTANLREDEQSMGLTSPFQNALRSMSYPPENAVRGGLYAARENSWFARWDDQARSDMKQYLIEENIPATLRLTEGLALGGLSAADALYEYFVSCYGRQETWTEALQQWYEAECAALGLAQAKAQPVALEEGVVSCESISQHRIQYTRFIGETPAELAQAFSHSKLEGWICLCGATAYSLQNGYGYGLAAFEKDGERLLIALRRKGDEQLWAICPVSKTALYTDRSMAILPRADGLAAMSIVYPGDETETFDVTVSETGDASLDAHITSYLRMNAAAGSGFELQLSRKKRITYENHRIAGEAEELVAFSMGMSTLEIHAFPTTPEAWEAARQPFPDGYAILSGVNLRKGTSSRSQSLGEYKRGVLVKVLGTEPGDPHPWVRVQVGRAEGYMCSVYVKTFLDASQDYVLSSALPVGKALDEVKLKKSPGRFSGSVTTLPAGTMFHVLAQRDDGWLHVSVPQGELGWMMDLNGTDGYLKEDDVIIAGNPMMLEWME